MPKADFRFRYQKRVRYAEIDAQAVVFNSRYLEYLDIGITEYWRAAGMYDNAPVAGGAEFHVAKNTVDYVRPLLLDEMMEICIRCRRIGRSSMTFDYEIHGAGDSDDLRARGEHVSVHVAEVKGPATPVPDWVVALFEAFEGRPLREQRVAA
jgi:acyl-CoA thioester hydrolase